MEPKKWKVLIVDDEKLVRTMIRYCVDWEEIGYQIVEECESALYALDLMEDVEPDVILTDICMPVVDGLELARRAKKINPAVKIIILTGHDNFDYAKEGIAIGVTEYLLKPIDSDELRQTLLHTKEAIVKEREQAGEFLRLRDMIKKQNTFMKERCLNELFHGADVKEIGEQLDFLGMSFQRKFFQVAVVGIFLEGYQKVDSTKERLLYRMRAYEILKEQLQEAGGMYVVLGDMQTSIILNSTLENNFSEICDNMIRLLSHSLQCKICIGIGSVCRTLEDVRRSYQEANDALQLHYTNSKSEVICFQDIYLTYNPKLAIDNEVIHRFTFYVRSGMLSNAKEAVNEMFDTFYENHGEKAQIVTLSVRLITEIETVLMELNLTASELVPGEHNLIKNLLYFESMGETQGYLEMILEAAVGKIVKNIKAKEKSLVGQACDYIGEHYMEEDLSLSQISKDIFVNTSYLSRVFKEKTGQTFRNYLFELRMKKAAELLKNKAYKGYEVAEFVGIKDPHYFSVCFKKYTGISVSDYKKSISN